MTRKDTRWRTLTQKHAWVPQVTLVQATSSHTVLVRSPLRLSGDSSDVLYTTYLQKMPCPNESPSFLTKSRLSADALLLRIDVGVAAGRLALGSNEARFGFLKGLASFDQTRVALEGGASGRSTSENQAAPHGGTTDSD